MRHESLQYGFTLLETVIVIFILAVIAGTVISVFNADVIEEKEITATKFEMQEIRKALLQYKTDNISLPASADRASPADIDFLINDPDPTPDNDWDPDYRTGWRGPYIPTSQTAFVDIGDNLDFDGTGNPLTIDTAPINDNRAIADAYSHFAEDADQAPSPDQECLFINDDSCLLEWHGDPTDNNSRIDKNGRPYLLFDLDNSDARIVSLGPDGVYDGVNADPCIAEEDDHVLCLY